MNTLTKKQIKSLNTAERLRLLKLLVDSFDSVTVTGLYGSEADVKSKFILRGKAFGKDPRGNDINISTDLTTG